MTEYRMAQAMKLLRETNISISEIADRVGYETQRKIFKSIQRSDADAFKRVSSYSGFQLERLKQAKGFRYNRLRAPPFARSALFVAFSHLAYCSDDLIAGGPDMLLLGRRNRVLGHDAHQWMGV